MPSKLEISNPFLDGSALVIDGIARCGFADSGYYKVSWHLTDGRRSTPSFNSSVENADELTEKVVLAASGVKNVNLKDDWQEALANEINSVMEEVR